MNHHAPTTLLTGATGFLGHHILRDLLLKGRHITALLRPPLTESAQRLQTILSGIGIDSSEYVNTGRLVLCAGELPGSLPTLDSVSEIVSCAASLQLISNGNEPFKTNVEGVDCLIEWAERHDIRCIHAVSTAYVCGAYKDNVCEVLHPEPPSFQTDYERSKWLAELKLTAWAQRKAGRTLTILRPSFLIGDSVTGHTTQYGGFYQFARLVALMTEHYHEASGSNGNGTYIPLRIPGRKNDPIQNFIPVDYAASMVAEIVNSPALHGRVYHLTDPQPPSWDDFKCWIELYFNIYGGYFLDSDELSNGRSEAESLLWEKYDLLMPRIHHHVQFDNFNARQAMERQGIVFPALTQERFFRLLDYAASKRWGQKNGRDPNGSHRKSRSAHRAAPQPIAEH